MKLLRIDSSARRNSVSRQLTERFVETWKKQNPAGEVIERDLANTHLPHITDEWMLAAPFRLGKSDSDSTGNSFHFRRADGRATGGGHDRDRSANAQPYSVRAIEGLDRPSRACRPDGPVGTKRYRRRSQGKEGCRTHVARWLFSSGHSHCPVRPSGALSAAHPRVHRIDEHYVHPR